MVSRIETMSNQIVENLKKEIENFSAEVKVEKVGKVLEVFDGTAKVSGLSDIRASEMVAFSNGLFGVALNLEEDAVGVIIFGDFSKIQEGDEVKATGKILEVSVGDDILGRVVNAIGAAGGVNPPPPKISSPPNSQNFSVAFSSSPSFVFF